MSDIIEHNGDDNNLVRIGDGQTPVPLKVYQDIYHQITGRTEQIRKRYTDNLLIDFAEIEQLNHKINQLCDVHHIIARSVTISVFHDKERKEQFTSFERFRIYNSNATSPTVSVHIKYNFAIVPAGLKKPQEYSVAIRLTSRIATVRQFEEEAPPFMRGRLFGFITSTVGEVTVEYADYIVARGFLEAFDEWARGCKSNPRSKILHTLRNYSHFARHLLQLFVVSLAVYYSQLAIPGIFSDQNSTALAARYLTIFAGASYALVKLAGLTGSMIEETIDNFPEISYLKLNKGDERLISEAEKQKPFAMVRLAAGAISSILISVAATKVEQLL